LQRIIDAAGPHDRPRRRQAREREQAAWWSPRSVGNEARLGKPERGEGGPPRALACGVRRTSPPELSDLPATFWDDAEVVAPTPKRAVSIRLDEDVVEWFRRSGPRYQTRMNAVLRMYVKRMRKGA
jgi:uncharacterized protein (DUF4415 family)